MTPKGARLAVGTPHNYPYVTPKEYHGTKGILKFGAMKKLFRVVGASTYLLSSSSTSGLPSIVYFSREVYLQLHKNSVIAIAKKVYLQLHKNSVIAIAKKIV